MVIENRFEILNRHVAAGSGDGARPSGGRRLSINWMLNSDTLNRLNVIKNPM
jgi:hypothetical protein